MLIYSGKIKTQKMNKQRYILFKPMEAFGTIKERLMKSTYEDDRDSDRHFTEQKRNM